MKKNIRILNIFMVILTSFHLLSCVITTTKFHGKIVDDKGNPIKNINFDITTYDYDKNISYNYLTDDLGQFTAELTHSRLGVTIKVTISLKGYKTLEKTFTADELHKKAKAGEVIKFVLESEI